VGRRVADHVLFPASFVGGGWAIIARPKRGDDLLVVVEPGRGRMGWVRHVVVCFSFCLMVMVAFLFSMDHPEWVYTVICYQGHYAFHFLVYRQ
jgi:hypothetical protein